MLRSRGVSAPMATIVLLADRLLGSSLRDLASLQRADHNWVSCFGFRPSQAEAIPQRWVAESRVPQV